MPVRQPPKKNLYEILGVSEHASADDIKRAYRDLAKTHHPDRTGGDKSKEASFKEMSAAYEVLSDPKKREQYDAMRRGGFGGDFTGGGFRGGGFPGGIPPGFEDIFAQIFRGAGGGFGNVRGDFVNGGIRFETGPIPKPPPRNRRAGAAKKVPADEPVTTPDGATLVRRGNDYYHDLELSLDEAILGAKVSVPTMDGRVTVTIPPGTSSGKKLRLREKGVAAKGARGDQYCVIQIVVPSVSDERTRELVRELARAAPVKPRR